MTITATAGVCRLCGCTEDKPCRFVDRSGDLGELPGGACSWVDAERTLCSACVLGGRELDDLPPTPEERELVRLEYEQAKAHVDRYVAGMIFEMEELITP